MYLEKLAVVCLVTSLFTPSISADESRERSDYTSAIEDTRPAPVAHLNIASKYRGCLACDACNATPGNHLTASGGSRGGAVHPCFDDSTCLVHDFNTECGGGSGDSDEAEDSRRIEWATVARLEGEELESLLTAFPERWRYDATRHALMWYDCEGVLVASLPTSRSQVAAVGTVLSNF